MISMGRHTAAFNEGLPGLRMEGNALDGPVMTFAVIDSRKLERECFIRSQVALPHSSQYRRPSRERTDR
jgi:hypothetical protein